MTKNKIITLIILFLMTVLPSFSQYRDLDAQKPVLLKETIRQSVAKNVQKDENQKLYGVVGKSQVIKFDQNIKRISITDPNLADIVVISPKQIVINGKKTGSTSLIFWANENEPIFYNLLIQQDADMFLQAVNYVAPNEDIAIIFNDEGAVLSGRVSSTNIKNKIKELAKAYNINLTDLSESNTKQVLLEVRVAEVSKNLIRELSVNFGLFDNARTLFPDITGTGAFNQASFTTFFQYLFADPNSKVAVQVKAAEDKGDFKILAEPKLLVMDGEEGSFNVGNEIPIPSSMGTYGTVAYSFKKSGVILNFTPTILEKSKRVKLKLAPEVSEVDNSVGIISSGTTIPGFKTRKVETTVELNDGETLVIAGLLNNSLSKNKTQVPLLGDIPILGVLFRSSQDTNKETEVMIFITPKIVDEYNEGENL